MTQPDTRPTADDFTPVTSVSRKRRHWSLARDMNRGLRGWNRPGQLGYTLCGGITAMDQERLDDEMPVRWRKRTVIADLPPCKQCDKSRNRRMEGRRS